MNRKDSVNHSSPARPRRGRARRLALGLTVLSAALLAQPRDGDAAPAKERKAAKAAKSTGPTLVAGVPIMRVDEVKPGMKGYAVTVFSGTQSERFEIEIIDVVHDYRPGQDAILFDSPDPRLIHSGIVGGMSGSPIFIDGKLVGALAYGYRYNKDPIGGITPIEKMLETGQLPFRPEALARPNMRSREGTAAWADAMLSLDHEYLPPRRRPDEVGAAARVTGLVPLGVPMSVSGFSPQSAAWLSQATGLEAVRGGSGGGGAAEKGTPKTWKPGDSVSVMLIAGDNAAASNGTVTWVGGDSGERLLAFGHSMFGDGPSRLPIADAKVHVIIPSVERSVKLSSPLTRQGTMIQDRQPAISLRTDIDTPMLPVTTIVNPGDDALPQRTYNSQVAEHVDLTPNLIASLLVDGLDEGAPDAVELVAKTKHQIVLETTRGRRTLDIEDETFFARGASAGALVRSVPFMVMAAALDNDFEIARIVSVTQEVSIDYGAEVLRIESVRLANDEVRAGEIARFEVGLRARQGELRWEEVALRVPEGAAGETLVFEFAGGDWASPYTKVPANVDDLIDNVMAGYPSRSLVTSIYRPEEGLATRSGLLVDLPDSVLETLSPNGSSEKPLRFKRASRRVLAHDKIIAGDRRLEVEILPAKRP